MFGVHLFFADVQHLEQFSVNVLQCLVAYEQLYSMQPVQWPILWHPLDSSFVRQNLPILLVSSRLTFTYQMWLTKCLRKRCRSTILSCNYLFGLPSSVLSADLMHLPSTSETIRNLLWRHKHFARCAIPSGVLFHQKLDAKNTRLTTAMKRRHAQRTAWSEWHLDAFVCSHRIPTHSILVRNNIYPSFSVSGYLVHITAMSTITRRIGKRENLLVDWTTHLHGTVLSWTAASVHLFSLRLFNRAFVAQSQNSVSLVVDRAAFFHHIKKTDSRLVNLYHSRLFMMLSYTPFNVVERIWASDTDLFTTTQHSAERCALFANCATQRWVLC